LTNVRSAWADLTLAWRDYKARHPSHFDPNQPRVPAGNSDGGQWTAGEQVSTGARLLDMNPADDIALAQIEMGTLLGQAIVHPS
jgi:hypothetical protein